MKIPWSQKIDDFIVNQEIKAIINSNSVHWVNTKGISVDH